MISPTRVTASSSFIHFFRHEEVSEQQRGAACSVVVSVVHPFHGACVCRLLLSVRVSVCMFECGIHSPDITVVSRAEHAVIMIFTRRGVPSFMT